MNEEFRYIIDFDNGTTKAEPIPPEEIAAQEKAAKKVALRQLQRATAKHIQAALDDVVGQVSDAELPLPCVVAIVAQYDQGRRKMTRRFRFTRILRSHAAFPEHDPRPTVSGYEWRRHTAKYPKPALTHYIVC